MSAVATSSAGVTEAMIHAQLAAIEESGWGYRFKFFQPRNLAFWVYLWLLILGGASMLSDLGNVFGAYQGAVVTGYVVFALYTVPFWLFINHLDRYDSIPGRVATIAFLWGGIIATFVLAIKANDAVLTLYGKAFGQAWVLDWGPGLTAPFTEEIAKGAGLVLLIVLAPRVVRSAFDGFILGAFIGLGFQVFEDVSYVINAAGSQFGANQGGAALQTIVMRSVVGITSHTLYSALFCMGLVWLIGRPTEPARRLRGLAFMVLAMLIHGVWDAMAALSGGSGVMTVLSFVVVPVFAIIVFVVALKWSSERPHHWMHDLMAPEAVRGSITGDELAVLSGSHRQRKAYVKAAKGHKSHAHARHVLTAATDLAKQLAFSNGADTPDVEFARAEVERVRVAPASHGQH
jgi:RsiW-degrading membrane proteinase PrsW (M82 family)